jgi:hypothetical protein
MSDTSIRNLIESQENLGFRSERTLDQGFASSATISLYPASIGCMLVVFVVLLSILATAPLMLRQLPLGHAFGLATKADQQGWQVMSFAADAVSLSAHFSSRPLLRQ